MTSMDGNIELRSIDETSASEWTAFVANRPDSTVFHSLGWLRTVETVFGYEPWSHLAYDRTGEPVAAIPGVKVFDGFGRSIINPFCEYGFPLIADSIADERVLSALRSTTGLLESVILKEVEWSSVDSYVDAMYGGVLTGTSRRLRLDEPFEELWRSAFRRQIRQRVRTAREHDLQTTEGSIEDFYSLYTTTMARLGSPQFPIRFFEELADRLEGAAEVLLASVNSRSIGALFTIEWGETTYIWGNGSIEEGLCYRPNHLLYMRAIKRACDRGQSLVDFGRSRHGSGVHEFKSQFGGTAHPLASFVAPPYRSPRASLEGYDRFAPVTRRLAPVVTHPLVGPRLKRLVHE